MRAAVWLLVACAACSAPDKLVADTCGNGVVDGDEDCEPIGSGVGSGFSCAATGAHACHFVCDPTQLAQQCPTGDACTADGVCVAEPDACGNGVVDSGEDCEPTLATGGTCAAPGAANACHFTCDAATACPDGFGCGRDSRCRAAAGSFAPAAGGTFLSGAGPFTLADVDGDGNPDVAINGANRVFFGAGTGTFSSTVAIPAAGIFTVGGDFNGDGRSDFASVTSDGLTMILGETDQTMSPLLFPIVDGKNLGDGVLGAPDLWVPIRNDAAHPFTEQLHIGFEADHVRLAFDESGDHTPKIIAGAHSPALAELRGGAPLFAIGDAFRAPAVGGDEIAITFAQAAVVHVFTASRDAGDLTPTLVADPDVTLPGPVLGVPLIVDIDGDGNLDLLANVQPAGLDPEVVVAFGNGTAFAAPVVDVALTDGQCFPTAAADLVGDARAKLYCGRLATRTNTGVGPSAPLFFISPQILAAEIVFADINRDGFLDAIAPADSAIQILFGDANGLFSSASLPLDGQPFNLRVGDFDGDGTTDVSFLTDHIDGTSSLSILYGTPAGLPSITDIAPLTNANSVEPALFGFDAVGAAGGDGTADLVITTTAQTQASMLLTLLAGDATRRPGAGFPLGDSTDATSTAISIGFPIFTGRFAAGATADEVLAFPDVVLKSTGDLAAELYVYDLGVGADHVPTGSAPVLRASPAHVDSFVNGNIATPTCLTEALADLDGDGVEELVFIHSGLPDNSDGCTPAGSEPKPQLLVLSTTHDNHQMATPLDIPLFAIDDMAFADLDHDGHPDLIALFAGDARMCVTAPCAPPQSGILVIWGSATGLGTQTTVIPIPAIDPSATTIPTDFVALNLDGDGDLELALATNIGIYGFDPQPDRSFKQLGGTAPLIPFDGSVGIAATFPNLGTGDVNRDGIADLLVNDNGTMHVFLGAAAN